MDVQDAASFDFPTQNEFRYVLGGASRGLLDGHLGIRSRSQHYTWRCDAVEYLLAALHRRRHCDLGLQ